MSFARPSMISGLFLLVMLPFMAMIGFFGILKALPQIDTPDLHALATGVSRHAFEGKFDESMPHRNFSLNIWGSGEYTLFHRGRPGVVIGRDGWLFTSEEFAVKRDDQSNYANNLNYLNHVIDTLDQQKVTVLVVPIPAKSRLYKKYLPDGLLWPAARQSLYPHLITDLGQSNVHFVDLNTAFSAATTPASLLFLKTDTHWTPYGAETAARAIAESVQHLNIDLGPRQTFERSVASPTSHDGDLRKYVPLGAAIDRLIPPDIIETPFVAAKGPGHDTDLFGDISLPITLVGTSYSANPKWGFAALLKQSIGIDLLNAADEGQGPFTTMQSYLKSDAFKNTPPKLIIWEIPERFLTFHYILDTQ